MLTELLLLYKAGRAELDEYLETWEEYRSDRRWRHNLDAPDTEENRLARSGGLTYFCCNSPRDDPGDVRREGMFPLRQRQRGRGFSGRVIARLFVCPVTG
jgi:hypothetical protein